MNRLRKYLNNISKINLFFLKKEAPSLVFLIIALMVGLVFIKNIGVFSGPDLSVAHYKSALALATGQIFERPFRSQSSKIVHIHGDEKYFLSGQDCIKNSLVATVLLNPLRSDKMNSCIHQYDKTLSTTRTVTTRATLQYPPLSYVPQASALAIGRALHLEPIFAQTLARLFNLLTYIILVIVAIRLLPGKGKWLFVFLALMPTALFLASSLSADGMNIAWSFLFVSYILRLRAQKTHLTGRQIALVAVLGFGLFMLKVAYTPLLLLILTLKAPAISTQRKWKLFIATFITGLIMYGLWSHYFGCLTAVVNPAQNLHTVLHHITQALTGIFIYVLYVPMKIFEAGQLLYFGLAILIALMILTSTRGMKAMPTRLLGESIRLYWLQIVGLVAAFLSLFLTSAALLITWTDIGAYGYMDIQGFQGRYILPLLPLLVLIYYVPQKKKKLEMRVRETK